MQKTGFIHSIKGKILVASVLACFAFFMAWQTSKDAFKAVLTSFQNISAPNEKLRLINEVSRNVARLDQEQKGKLSGQGADNVFFDESRKLNRKIDTLRNLYAGNDNQLKRIDLLKKLLHDRDRLYMGYLDVRAGLVNNKSFSTQVQQLDDLVNETAKQTDSVVTTSVKKTATISFMPEPPPPVKEKRRGFFRRIFGGGKKRQAKVKPARPYQVVDSEMKVKDDTLAVAVRDSLLRGVGKTIKSIEKAHEKKSRLFVQREALLNKARQRLIAEIQVILKKVENEAITQRGADNQRANMVMRSSLKRISFIMALFFVSTVLLVYLILRDVSRINKYRKEIEKAKEDAEYHAQAKQRFLSNMSHELRTPLQSILGYAELLKKQRHPHKQDVDAIYNSSAHLLQIVNEVLDYNRIVSGKLTFVNEVFYMEELLDEVTSIMRLQATKKQLVFNTKYDDSVRRFLNGDPFRLKQILYNLIGNAVKFTHYGEVGLKVSGESCGQGRIQYRFDVKDTGVGLAANELGRIFSEFEQAGDERQARKGAGLGLAITKQLIESLGGSISVKSKPSEGSCFTVLLTLESAADVLPEEALPAISGDDAGSRKVWIVDDDRFILDLCSRILHDNGVSCRCFESPAEALNTPWDDSVTHLLVDVRMNGMSGIELCRRLKPQIPQTTRIYALTAQAMPEEQQQVMQGGFNGILIKPFREKELLALVQVKRKPEPVSGIPPLDIKVIEKMAFGDEDAVNRLLLRFSEDSLHDIDELYSRINEQDTGAVLLLVHRIAGRTAQAGGRELGQEFRRAEIQLEREGRLDAENIKHILELAGRLNDLAMATRNMQ